MNSPTRRNEITRERSFNQNSLSNKSGERSMDLFAFSGASRANKLYGIVQTFTANNQTINWSNIHEAAGARAKERGTEKLRCEHLRFAIKQNPNLS